MALPGHGSQHQPTCWTGRRPGRCALCAPLRPFLPVLETFNVACCLFLRSSHPHGRACEQTHRRPEISCGQPLWPVSRVRFSCGAVSLSLAFPSSMGTNGDISWFSRSPGNLSAWLSPHGGCSGEQPWFQMGGRNRALERVRNAMPCGAARVACCVARKETASRTAQAVLQVLQSPPNDCSAAAEPNGEMPGADAAAVIFDA